MNPEWLASWKIMNLCRGPGARGTQRRDPGFFPMTPPLVTRIPVSLYQPLEGPKGFLCTSSEISNTSMKIQAPDISTYF